MPACSVDYTIGTVRILCVATKPPWPPRDGGRLALWLTLQGLAAAGHEIVLVAPRDDAGLGPESGAALDLLSSVCDPRLVPAAKRNWWAAAAVALLRKRAFTVVRHHSAEVEHAVADCVSSWHPDVLHVEQLQALANCGAAQSAGIPIGFRLPKFQSSLSTKNK